MGHMRIALYGDVNLNLIDGSAIWMASLAESLHVGKNTAITLLLKCPEQRDVITRDLHELPRLQIIRPETWGFQKALKPEEAVDILQRLDEEQAFDVILLRGWDVCRQAALSEAFNGRLWMYLVDLPRPADRLTPEKREDLSRMASASRYFLCQTEDVRAYIEHLVPESPTPCILLPMMVPSSQQAGKNGSSANGSQRLFYAGKFSPLWGSLEMVEAFSALRADFPALELHVAGDKIHNPPEDPSFAKAMRRALEETEGLIWHGGITRNEVQSLLSEADLAFSVRNRAVNGSLEMSTKVLEYGSAGVPVVLNRTPMYEDLLGADYPLFVDSFDDVAPVVRQALEGVEVRIRARSACEEAARGFSFPEVYRRLEPHLERVAPPELREVHATSPTRVLIAGHNTKFLDQEIAYLTAGGCDVKRDVWLSHSRHDEAKSLKLLEWAEVVICEWCLGNAVWYSQHKRPGQRLIVRFHRMETETDFPFSVLMDNVDHMVFIAPWVLRWAHDMVGWDPAKLSLVPNGIDIDSLDRPKLSGAGFNLGLMGYVPALKRIDLALDLLELLRARDERFHLYVKGRSPFELDWVVKRPEEIAYFEEQTERIRRSPLLREGVSFDDFGNNVASWFRKVGFVLSVSDIEGSHVSLAEGMASRAVPVIREWHGAADLYERRWIRSDMEDAADWILRATQERRRAAEGEDARSFVAERWAFLDSARIWGRMVTGTSR